MGTPFTRLLTAARHALQPASKPDAPPTVCMVYIHFPGDAEHLMLTKRFVDSYLQYPPGHPHRTIVVCQGRKPEAEMKALLLKLPGCTFYQHDDTGWDIGGFIAVSRIISEDIIACMGGTAFVQKEGWLKRMVEVWQKHGPGFYGSLSTYEMTPHINTSGFWCAPALLAEYPKRVQTKAQRYQYEHGGYNSFWRCCLRQGVKVMVATWDGEYEWFDWRKETIPNIYRRGDQSNCLTFFRHTERFRLATPEMRKLMAQYADTLTDKEFIELERDKAERERDQEEGIK